MAEAVVKSWRCFFGFHWWTQWADCTATVTGPFFRGPRQVDCQQRRCIRCNLADTKLL